MSSTPFIRIAKGRCIHSTPSYTTVTILLPQNIRLDSQCSCRLHYSFLRHFRYPYELQHNPSHLLGHSWPWLRSRHTALSGSHMRLQNGIDHQYPCTGPLPSLFPLSVVKTDRQHRGSVQLPGRISRIFVCRPKQQTAMKNLPIYSQTKRHPVSAVLSKQNH